MLVLCAGFDLRDLVVNKMADELSHGDFARGEKEIEFNPITLEQNDVLLLKLSGVTFGQGINS